MTKFQISVVSDTVCPWCYVGKIKLERGIAAYQAAHPSSKDTFETTWFPFYLYPNAPKVGQDKKKVLRDLFGPERTKVIEQHLAALGKEVGIDFKFGGKTGNTRDSHRLIQLAKSKGSAVQTRLVEELFKSYFENEQDITSHADLQEAAVRAGLDEAEVGSWLDSDKGGDEVDAEADEARSNLVSGVPNFVIQNKYQIQGAQDADAFKQIFERVKALEG